MLKDKSYKHNFTECGDIEVMMCDDTVKFVPFKEREVIQLKDVYKIIDQMKKELQLATKPEDIMIFQEKWFT